MVILPGDSCRLMQFHDFCECRSWPVREGAMGWVGWGRVVCRAWPVREGNKGWGGEGGEKGRGERKHLEME